MFQELQYHAYQHRDKWNQHIVFDHNFHLLHSEEQIVQEEGEVKLFWSGFDIRWGF